MPKEVYYAYKLLGCIVQIDCAKLIDVSRIKITGLKPECKYILRGLKITPESQNGILDTATFRENINITFLTCACGCVFSECYIKITIYHKHKIKN